MRCNGSRSTFSRFLHGRAVQVLFAALPAALVIAGCGGGGGSDSGGGPTPPPSPSAVTVDYGTQDQMIRGIGGATGFLGQFTAAQAKALFSPTDGLGLSMLRVIIDPAGQNNNAPVNISQNGYTVNWNTEAANGAAAVANNPDAIVFASPYTPPVSLKTSSSGQPYYSGSALCGQLPGTTDSLDSRYCGGYLDPANYGAYAAYLNSFVTYYKANSGAKLYAVSMQNEPDYSAQPGENYESCSWTPTQMKQWIDTEGSTLSVPLMMPESYTFDQTVAAPSLSDATTAGNISIIAGHLYMNGESQGTPVYYSQAADAGKEVWMTEHYLSPANGNSTAIGDAIHAAGEIHDSFVVGRYNAYVWYRMWNSTCAFVNSGLLDSGTGESSACGTSATPKPTYFGYAIGQFSKFIQPGYYRYDATAAPAAGVHVSAYSGNDSGGTHYVIVAINAGSGSASLSFSIHGATVSSLTPWQTTSSGGLVKQTAIPVSNGSFTTSLPAQSITTFVQ